MSSYPDGELWDGSVHKIQNCFVLNTSLSPICLLKYDFPLPDPLMQYTLNRPLNKMNIRIEALHVIYFSAVKVGIFHHSQVFIYGWGAELVSKRMPIQFHGSLEEGT